jgi:hypothetical protein
VSDDKTANLLVSCVTSKRGRNTSAAKDVVSVAARLPRFTLEMSELKMLLVTA